MINVYDFHKAYDRTVAVAGLSFEVSPGSILGLIGPNGAGKTTTLKALTGIIPASRGALRIGGFDVQESPIETKRRLAYIPDDPQLFHDLTVEQHLAFVASAYQVENAESRAETLLEEFELTEKLHVPAADLSRGMRQKLAICCGYLHNPSAILFDEPLTGLDPRGIRGLKASIKFRAESGAAVIISSHLLAMVEDICTHLLILDRGRQRFLGPIKELRSSFGVSNDADTTLEDIFFRATGPVLDPELVEA